jgi:hypothetical protein
VTASLVTACPRGCTPAFLEGFGTSLRCRRCGWQAETGAPALQPCPRCGAEIPLAARTHPACGWGGSASTLSVIEPSVRVSEPTPERARDLTAARAEFDRDAAALREALVQVERLLGRVKVGAQRIGTLGQLQSGRAAASTRDSLLHATRTAVSEAANRLEHAAWTVL